MSLRWQSNCRRARHSDSLVPRPLESLTGDGSRILVSLTAGSLGLWVDPTSRPPKRPGITPTGPACIVAPPMSNIALCAGAMRHLTEHPGAGDVPVGAFAPSRSSSPKRDALPAAIARAPRPIDSNRDGGVEGQRIRRLGSGVAARPADDSTRNRRPIPGKTPARRLGNLCYLLAVGTLFCLASPFAFGFVLYPGSLRSVARRDELSSPRHRARVVRDSDQNVAAMARPCPNTPPRTPSP